MMKDTGLNAEGGCAVDWGWLVGERIAAVTSSLDAVTLTFESGLVFTVRGAIWQGQAFLAFDPYKRPPPLTPTK